MKLNEDHTKELKDISNGALFNMEKKNIFQAPEGYFDTLPKQILQKVLHQASFSITAESEVQEISPLLVSIKGKSTFSAPEGYFDTLPSQILQKIFPQVADFSITAEQEIHELSPLLASLKNKPTFSAPAGYFNSLSNDVVNKVSEAEQPDSAPIYTMPRSRSWIKYSAAAAIVGFIGISAFFLLNNNKQTPPTSSIASSKENKSANGNDFLDVSDGSLAQFLSDTPSEKEQIVDGSDTSLYDVALLNMNDNDIAKIIHEIPDEDLMSYETDSQDELHSL